MSALEASLAREAAGTDLPSADGPPWFHGHFPRAPLSGPIECLWFARGMVDYRRERVLPNGVVEVIVNLGNPHKVVDGPDFRNSRLYRESWIAGIQNHALVIEAVRETDLVGIRFRPGGAYALTRFPLREVTDQVVELDLIEPAFFRELRSRLMEVFTLAQRIAVVEHMLLERLDFGCGHPAVSHICERLRATRGTARIGDLVEEVGLSHRRTLDYFQRMVGMPPKALAAIYRFQAVLAQVRGVAAPDWSAVAAECGYADQSHLNHDFRRLGGLTPGEYVASRLDDINHTVAD